MGCPPHGPLVDEFPVADPEARGSTIVVGRCPYCLELLDAESGRKVSLDTIAALDEYLTKKRKARHAEEEAELWASAENAGPAARDGARPARADAPGRQSGAGSRSPRRPRLDRLGPDA